MTCGKPEPVHALSDADSEHFIRDGFIRIDGRFRASLRTRPAPSYGATPAAILTIRRRRRRERCIDYFAGSLRLKWRACHQPPEEDRMPPASDQSVSSPRMNSAIFLTTSSSMPA